MLLFKMNSLICLATILAIASGGWIGQPYGGPYNQYQPVYVPPQNPGYAPLWPRNEIGQQNMVSPPIQDPTISGPIGSESYDDSFRDQLLSHETIEETQQRKLFDIINKMEKSIVQPEPSKANETSEPSKASQMAQEMLQQSRQAELVHLQESLQELQQPSPKSIWALHEVSKVQQVAHEIAVEDLKKSVSEYQVSQLPEKQDNLTKLLNETLQVAIRGQMAIHNLQSQHSIEVLPFLAADQLIKNFTSDVQQLLATNNLFHTQKALVEYQMNARQIQLQQNFLKKQIQQLQVYQLLLRKQLGTLPDEVSKSLQKSHQEMYGLQQQLQAQQFAQQMLISRLQQVLISQRVGIRQLAAQKRVQAQRGINQFVYGYPAGNVLYT